MVQLEHNPLKKPAGTRAGVRVWQGFQKRYPDPDPANPDPLPVRVLPTRGLPYSWDNVFVLCLFLFFARKTYVSGWVGDTVTTGCEVARLNRVEKGAQGTTVACRRRNALQVITRQELCTVAE
jgi:hypothetical protein